MTDKPPVSVTSSLFKVILIAGLVLTVFTTGFFISLNMSKQPADSQKPLATKHSTLLPSPKILQKFNLSDHTNTAFTDTSLKNKWTFLSFGYTHCPDICPTTLSVLSQMDDQLKAKNITADYQIVFVSIDPERDTLDRLEKYVPYFNPEFIGVTGIPEALQALTKQLGILYLKVETETSAMGYLMDHSASIILTNPKGEYHAVFSAPHTAEGMANDFELISSHFQ